MTSTEFKNLCNPLPNGFYSIEFNYRTLKLIQSQLQGDFKLYSSSDTESDFPKLKAEIRTEGELLTHHDYLVFTPCDHFYIVSERKYDLYYRPV